MLLPEPPVPIAASYNAPGPTLVTFSTFLEPGLLDPTNWFVYWPPFRWSIVKAEVVHAHPNPIIELTRGFFALAAFAPHVEYIPPPFDVRSRIGGLPAPAFPHFPLDP